MNSWSIQSANSLLKRRKVDFPPLSLVVSSLPSTVDTFKNSAFNIRADFDSIEDGSQIFPSKEQEIEFFQTSFNEETLHPLSRIKKAGKRGIKVVRKALDFHNMSNPTSMLPPPAPVGEGSLNSNNENTEGKSSRVTVLEKGPQVNLWGNPKSKFKRATVPLTDKHELRVALASFLRDDGSTVLYEQVSLVHNYKEGMKPYTFEIPGAAVPRLAHALRYIMGEVDE